MDFVLTITNSNVSSSSTLQVTYMVILFTTLQSQKQHATKIVLTF